MYCATLDKEKAASTKRKRNTKTRKKGRKKPSFQFAASDSEEPSGGFFELDGEINTDDSDYDSSDMISDDGTIFKDSIKREPNIVLDAFVDAN
mmetsp:Transcript_25905/g.29824  ORF Transcript_25905/g.29824 Transcript_25905/m.29824 type:complete len:93 (+) Transcript_25905:245-523(+)